MARQVDHHRYPDDEHHALELEYREANENYRLLTDIRFKLLGFVPLLGGIAAYLLTLLGLGVDAQPSAQERVLLSLALLISLGGACVTLGIIAYDQRNSELYDGLLHRLRHLEGFFGSRRSLGSFKNEANYGGQISERTSKTRRLPVLGLVGHDKGLALIYGPVFAAWFFPASVAAVRLTGLDDVWMAGPFVITVVIASLMVWQLLQLDTQEFCEWKKAGAEIEAAESAVRGRSDERAADIHGDAG